MHAVTPYWRVSGSGQTGPLGRALVACAVFGLVPTLLFILWLNLAGAEGLAVDRIPWRTWLAFPFLPLSPVLVVVWESTLLRLLSRLAAGGSEEGWPLASLQRATRRVDRWYWPVASLFMLVGAGGYLWVDISTGAGRWTIAATLIAAFLGLAVGTGVWAAAKTLTVVRVALRPVLAWNPYLAQPVEGIEELSRFAYLSGVLFSAGAVFVPGLIDFSTSFRSRSGSWSICSSPSSPSAASGSSPCPPDG